jgi:purine-binding chemotaxis protein CheW
MGAVREIIPSRAVTRLPGSPPWVLGLLNLRGSVLTVVDLAGRLGLGAGAAQSVVVVEAQGRALGVRVDAVETVALAEDARVEAVEAARSAEGLVAGMVRLRDGTALLMDAEVILRPFRTDG